MTDSKSDYPLLSNGDMAMILRQRANVLKPPKESVAPDLVSDRDHLDSQR